MRHAKAIHNTFDPQRITALTKRIFLTGSMFILGLLGWDQRRIADAASCEAITSDPPVDWTVLADQPGTCGPNLQSRYFRVACCGECISEICFVSIHAQYKATIMDQAYAERWGIQGPPLSVGDSLVFQVTTVEETAGSVMPKWWWVTFDTDNHLWDVVEYSAPFTHEYEDENCYSCSFIRLLDSVAIGDGDSILNVWYRYHATCGTIRHDLLLDVVREDGKVLRRATSLGFFATQPLIKAEPRLRRVGLECGDDQCCVEYGSESYSFAISINNNASFRLMLQRLYSNGDVVRNGVPPVLLIQEF